MNKTIQQYSRSKTTKWLLLFQYLTIALLLVRGIILIPIYLKFIPLGVYGAWLATGNILAWVAAVDPGLSAILQQRIATAYGKKDFQTIREVMAGGFVLTTIIVFIIFTISIVIAKYIPAWLILDPGIDVDLIVQSFIIAAYGFCFMIMAYSITAINRGLLSSISIGIIGLTGNVLSIFFIIFLLYNGYGLLALPSGILINGIVFALGNSIYLLYRVINERIGIGFSLIKVPVLAKLMSYTFFGSIGGTLTNKVDLFVVSRYLGLEAVAVLHLTRKSPEICSLFAERPPVAFMPTVAHLLGTGDLYLAKVILLRLIRLMLWILGLMLGGLIAFNDNFVNLWVGAQFFAGSGVNFGICIGLFILAFTSSLGNLCFAIGNIKGKSMAEFAQALIYIPLMILGTKYFGLIGCVISPIIAVVAVKAWYYPYSFKRILNLSVEQVKNILREILIIIVVAIPLVTIFYNFTPGNWYSFSVVVLIFVSLYFTGVFLFSREFRVESLGIYKNIHYRFTRILQNYVNK